MFIIKIFVSKIKIKQNSNNMAKTRLEQISRSDGQRE